MRSVTEAEAVDLPLAPVPRDPSARFWDPVAQTMGPGKRREIQVRGLRRVVERALQVPVPHFRRKLETAGLAGPQDIKSIKDLEFIPTTVKDELRESEADHPPVGDYRFTDLHDCVRIGTSTGTTGTPTVMLWTRHDIVVECDSAARTFWRRGYRPGMVATHAHPGYLYGGGLLLSSVYEYFGFVNMWVPPPDTDELATAGIRMWQRIRPDVPYASFALNRYREVCHQLGLDPEADVGLTAPPLPSGRGTSPLTTAGLECFAYLGGECEERAGAHLADDRVIVQAVDPATGREVPDGDWGNLVVTTIGRDNPVIRYDLDEACALVREPCPCGETSMRGYWGGRFRDLVDYQGRKFLAAEFAEPLHAIPEVAAPTLEYLVVRSRAGGPPVVRVERGLTAGLHEDLARRCQDAIRAKLGVDVTVQLLARGALPRAGFKTSRVTDE